MLKLQDAASSLQDVVNSLNQSLLQGKNKEEEETCPHRIKQTKNRKTIAINCKECDAGSSLNDSHCRKNIFGILQKEIHADCLVLSKLYERDYEGKSLALLYALASFKGTIAAYRSTEVVPEACSRPEKKECSLERKEIISTLAETVETDPLKARLELREIIQGKIQGKMTGRVPDTTPICLACSECFYSVLNEIEEKMSGFPEVPVIKKSGYNLAAGWLENVEEKVNRSEEKAGKKVKGTIGGKAGKRSGNLIEDISGEVNPASLSGLVPHSVPSAGKKKKGKFANNFTDSTDNFFDYESRIKSHVRPPFSSSRIYTEAPENTEFLECYDINGREGRNLEVSIYRYTDRPEKLYMLRPPEYNLRQEELRLLEVVRKRMIRHRPKDLAFADPTGAREYFKRMAKDLLGEELLESGKACGPDELESYADLLARYTNGLGILEDLLSDAGITDVYINAPADTNPVHVVMDGEECTSNVFLSQDDLDSLVSRFRTISGRPFGEAIPVLELNLEAFGVRVSVIGDPLSANGLAYAFRKHSLTPWTLPKLINTGSISPFAAGFLSFLMDGQASILVAGEVGAGKTSLLSAMLLEIPQKYRILTIEDTHELPTEQLQELGWKVQGMSSYSSVLKSGAEMSPETALRASLRLGSSSLVLGEVRGPEVKVLYEAMQVGNAGNSVIGTIHGSSVENVYERIVHTLGVPPASFKATDAVIICSGIRPGGSMKKIKRVSQIAEVTSTSIEDPEPSELFTDIMHYDASQDCLLAGEVLEQGQSELIGKIARKWGISIDSALKNIELRTRIKEKIATEGVRSPFLLEAEAVSEANNMFWLLSDSIKAGDRAGFETGPDSISGADLEELYRQWETWFENFARIRAGTGKQRGTENQETGNQGTGKRLSEEKQLLEEKRLSEEKQLPEEKITV
ncbi:MAG: type II/IV secretion system ATPase subunit [Methanosarcina sp.]|uniref:type II/IV secretion system ATPase subunit n=1 Tax=Methanosarcina sp. TaxID=2213 RepID=UPI00262D12E5|nr:type II/IV secretion system ATPase subunit [Methanosarcina sp.]MDD3248022.1 type II/IV secretion system ATPase subunit [Methanosarcina sp.]MDD4248095.1 type II/IV secretion system ATPase subunit [Methanosarcina sp.]